jgi:hypothetical protein
MKQLLFLLLILNFTSSFAQECPDSCSYFIPNSLTPDCDQAGCEILEIVSDCSFKKFEFKLFNRWGQVIFESSSPKKKFDCTGQNSGTYFWTFSGQFCNGNTFNDTGYITIIN